MNKILSEKFNLHYEEVEEINEALTLSLKHLKADMCEFIKASSWEDFHAAIIAVYTLGVNLKDERLIHLAEELESACETLDVDILSHLIDTFCNIGEEITGDEI